MLSMWGLTATSRGRKRCAAMVNQWFDEIDKDGSGEIVFDEFRDWYQRTMLAASAYDEDV